VTLTDTGPLVALIDRNDPNHVQCLDATKHLPSGSLVTSWPYFTEAMHLLFRAGGHAAQQALWQLRSTGRLALHESTSAGIDRMTELMDKYQDKPPQSIFSRSGIAGG